MVVTQTRFGGFTLLLLRNTRTTDSPITARSAEFLFRLAPRLAACALLAATGICSAQDARSLVVRAVAADDHSDRLARNYTYKVRDEIRELDAAGQVKSVHSTVDEVLYIGVRRYFRPSEKDGKPISETDQRKEQAKLDRAAAHAGRITEAERNKRIEDDERDRAKRRAEFKDIPDAFDFKLRREAVIDGRGAYEISATPRAGYHGAIRGILTSLEGTLWIDKKDFIWVKFEADALKAFSIGWFLARVGEGTHLSYEMMRVNDELWVPKEVSLKASARLALLRKINVEQKITFSEYRRFQTDSRVVSTGDEP
jgi:hypothetical protein